MSASHKYQILLFVLLCGVLSPSLAQQAAEMVHIDGAIAEDVYAAGGTVDVNASVKGDVVAAVGRVAVRDRVSGDVMAAGGAVTVGAIVGNGAGAELFRDIIGATWLIPPFVRPTAKQ